MKRIYVYSMLALLFTVYTADATLIAWDDFESYVAGNDLIGGSGGDGWTGSWTGGAGDVTVESAIIPAQSLSMQVSDVGDTSNLIRRNFPSQTGTIYAGFQVRPSSFEDDDFIQLYFSSGGNQDSALSGGIRNVGGNPFFARAGGIANNTDSSVSAIDDQTYQVVLRLARTGASHASNYDRVDLFVDQLAEGIPNASTTGNSNTPSLDTFTIRTHFFEAGDFVGIDHLRIATTYDEALAPVIPEPSPWALLGLGLILLRGLRFRMTRA